MKTELEEQSMYKLNPKELFDLDLTHAKELKMTLKIKNHLKGTYEKIRRNLKKIYLGLSATYEGVLVKHLYDLYNVFIRPCC